MSWAAKDRSVIRGRLVRKRVFCANASEALGRGRKPSRASSQEQLESKHYAEAVAELYYMEHLRGLPGIPVLYGAWVTASGLSYVVGDAGPNVRSSPEQRLKRLREHYEDLARTRPIALAKALLHCFRSFAEVGGYFSDDLKWGQFAVSVTDAGVVDMTLVDGPKVLAAESPVRPYLGAFGHVLEPQDARACATNGDCPGSRKHHSCVEDGVGAYKVGVPSPLAPKTRTLCRDGSTSAPEAQGWCDKATRTCRPISAATHAYDAASRLWAIPFLIEHALDKRSAVALGALAKKLLRTDPGDRPTFTQALAFLDDKTTGIREPAKEGDDGVRPRRHPKAAKRDTKEALHV